MIQRSLASSSKGSATGRTSKGLDPLGLPLLAIAHQRVDLSIGNPEVGAEGIWTSEPLGVYAFGCSPAAFHLRPGTRHLQALALHPMKEWSRDDRRGNCLGSGASADDGASCAWPRLLRRKAEEGTSQDAKAAPKRGGGRPRAGTRRHEGPYESSLLEMGSMVSSLRSEDKQSLPCCQVIGRED
jgi:hypothetical protein